jgi:hypothetical protein
MIERYHLFILFLKLNGFFFIGLVAQYLMSIYFVSRDVPNIRLLGVAVGIYIAIIVLLYYAFAYYGARKGSIRAMALFALVSFANFALLVYITIDSYVGDASKFRHTIKWLTGFIAMQSVTNGVSLYLSLVLISDIRNGLGDLVSKKNQIIRNNTVRFEVE